VILPAARPRYAQADRAPSPPALAPRLRHHGHEPEREAPVPIDDRIQQLITAGNGRRRGAGPGGVSARDGAAASLAGSHSGGPARVGCRRGGSRVPPPARRGRPGPHPCSAGPPDHRGRHSRGCRGPALARRSCRAESGTAPPCMRWRGRARPRRAGWPAAWSSPRVARRPPGPSTRATSRSPGSSSVPGVAPGWCPFPAVKALLLPPQAPRKALRPAISCCSAIHGRLRRKQAVIRISHRLSTGLLTVCPQAAECQPENTTTAGAECPVLSSQLAT